MIANPYKATYQRAQILGKEGILCNERIDHTKLPKGIYAYDIRIDENGEAEEVRRFVPLRFGGTILIKEILNLNPAGYLSLKPTDVVGLGGSTQPIKLRDFLKGSQSEPASITIEDAKKMKGE